MRQYFLILFCIPFYLSSQSVFISGDIEICSNIQQPTVKVSFRDATPPFNFKYAIDGLDESSITTDENPYFIHASKSGIYTITFFSDATSIGDIDGSAIVNILPAPTCFFSTDSDTLTISNKNIKLNDFSSGNIFSWNWNFGDGNTSILSSPHHYYQDDKLGVYQISLVVTNGFGCSDTMRKEIWITDDHWIYIPNTFTPNNDNLNDKFCIEYNGIQEETFIFRVYGPFGNLVYESQDPSYLRCSNEAGWDGSNIFTRNHLQEAHPLLLKNSYSYMVFFKDFQGWKHKEYGYITLIR